MNRYPPKFDKDVYTAFVKTPYGNGDYFFMPSTYDEDSEKTCRGLEHCPCADVQYSITSGNDEALFMIDPLSGAVAISMGSYLKRER